MSPMGHIGRRRLERLLRDAAGLRQLCRERRDEDDHLEFKVDLELRDPAMKDEVRADCAALATAGTGFLVIGLDESRDGRNAAAAVPGIPLPRAGRLKAAVEDVLGDKLDPPIASRRTWLVDLPDQRAVLVVRVRGRRGYPISVERGEGVCAFFVREAGKKKLLTPAQARQRRAEIDRRRWPRIVAALAAVFGLVAVLLALRNATVTDKLAANAEHRSLHEDQRNTLQAALRALPKRRLLISRGTDSESAAYLQEILSQFLAAGWAANGGVAPTLSGEGVFVLVNQNTDRREAEQLASALIRSGIACRLERVPENIPNFQEKDMVLFVGTKPR